MKRSDFGNANRSSFWKRTTLADSARPVATKTNCRRSSNCAFDLALSGCAAPPSRSAFGGTKRACGMCRIASSARAFYAPARCRWFPVSDQMSPRLASHAVSLVSADSSRRRIARVAGASASAGGDNRSPSTACAPCCCAYHGDDA